MKHIKINTPWGEYVIPLQEVAEHKACYYYDNDEDEFEDTIEMIMNDDFEGIDWILNNSDWEDWTDITEPYSNIIKVTEDEFWTSSDNFEIIDL